jgi:hypothetical protein
MEGREGLLMQRRGWIQDFYLKLRLAFGLVVQGNRILCLQHLKEVLLI